jgi:membrane fusion protein (multidrug efflux system)
MVSRARGQGNPIWKYPLVARALHLEAPMQKAERIHSVPDLPVETAPRRPRKLRRLLIFAAIGALVGSVAAWQIVSGWGKQWTDNAQVDGHVVIVGARIPGQVAAVLVREGQRVKKGDVLVALDDSDLQLRLKAAEADLAAAVAARDGATANVGAVTGSTAAGLDGASAGENSARSGAVSAREAVAQARAQVRAAASRARQATADRKRAETLFKDGAFAAQARDAAVEADEQAAAALSQARAGFLAAQGVALAARQRIDEAAARVAQARTGDHQVDAAVAQAHVAEARAAQAEAARDGVRLQLGYTAVRAPFDGVVTRRAVEVGQMVAAGTGVIGLVGTDEVWVTANFKETQVEGLADGQRASVKIDGCSERFAGVVEAVTAATGSRFALLPQDNSVGNFTKVVQRVPVRIALPAEAAARLRPGESAEVTVYTN